MHISGGVVVVVVIVVVVLNLQMMIVDNVELSYSTALHSSERGEERRGGEVRGDRGREGGLILSSLHGDSERTATKQTVLWQSL